MDLFQEPEEMLPFNLIQLLGELTEEKTERITKQLLSIDLRNQVMEINQPIHLIINCGGGPLIWAWQICDIMDCIKTPVHTIGVGNIASAALFIFLNGEKGHRLLSSRAAIMSHEFSWVVDGTYSQLKAAEGEADNIYKRVIEHYKKTTGLSKEEITKNIMAKNDKWFTPARAKKLNLADKIVSFKRSNPFKLIKELSIENQILARKEYERQLEQNQINDLSQLLSEVEVEVEDDE